MRIFEHRKSGELISFEVRNVGRARARRIVQELFPGVAVREQRGDEFASFELNDKRFVLEEPFGDNSRYLIYQQPPQPSTELEAIRTALERYRVSWIFSGDRSFRFILVALALLVAGIVLAAMVILR